MQSYFKVVTLIIGSRLLQTITCVMQYSVFSLLIRAARGREPHMKGAGMLVVSPGSVNFDFWSLFGCSGQKANTFSRQGLV